MARRHTHTPLAVLMNNRRVGTLQRAPDGAVSFSYAPEWLSWPHAMPISLSLPLTDETQRGGQVLAVFDNLLPDHDGIRRRLAARVGADGTDAYSLLARIGRDCVGALQLLPEDALDDDSMTVETGLSGQELSEAAIAAMLSSLDALPLGIDRDRDFRISVAGAQEKTALTRLDGPDGPQWLEPHGTTPTTHILKPAIGQLPNGMDLSDSVANEYFCLRLLAEADLPVAHAEMARFGEVDTLVVERFDRQWLEDGRLIRLPQEDCCQALGIPPALKYQSDGGPGIVEIMRLLQASDDPVTDRERFFTAQIIFWLIGATDGHGKNFSLKLYPGGGFRLAPLYDVMTVEPSLQAGQLQKKDMKLAMGFGRNRHYRVQEITGRHVVQTGRDSDLSLPAIRAIAEQIADTLPDALTRTRETTQTNGPIAVPDHIGDSLAKALPGRLDALISSFAQV